MLVVKFEIIVPQKKHGPKRNTLVLFLVSGNNVAVPAPINAVIEKIAIGTDLSNDAVF